MHAGARIAGRIESDAERVADSRAHVLGERHLGVLGDMSGEHAERLVRVDATVARTGDRLAPLEREPGRVREQVANRRARRAGRLVEVDDPFLRGDERRERGNRLRHRGEPNGARRVATRRSDPVRVDDSRGREVDGPAVDLA